ncbi:UNVERIFIED_CONTAM: Growth factor receptor-bound protein 10 [Gekko kuhli]
MMGSESKFLFRKNYAKYEFFKNPVNFFPEQMVAWCQQSNGCIPQSQLLQNFLNSSSCPEIQGFLHVKELGRKSWKKLYVCLRRSGLYCSTKGSSKKSAFPESGVAYGKDLVLIDHVIQPVKWI